MIVGVIKDPVSPEGKHSVVPCIHCGHIELDIPDYDMLGLFREEAAAKALTPENIADRLYAFLDLEGWCLRNSTSIVARRIKEHIRTKLQDMTLVSLKEEGKYKA